MPHIRMLLATAVAVVAMTPPNPLAAPALVVDQVLMDLEFELNGVDYDNPLAVAVDAGTVQDDPQGVNEESGDHNLQENKSILAPTADSDLRQSLTGNSFNTDTAELSNPRMHNAVSLDVTASEEITDNVGINTAAGAFNLQSNASVTAVGGDVLAQSSAIAQQDSRWNDSVLNNVTNDVGLTITIEEVSANVGINTVSGVGNEQSNTFTIRLQF